MRTRTKQCHFNTFLKAHENENELKNLNTLAYKKGARAFLFFLNKNECRLLSLGGKR